MSPAVPLSDLLDLLAAVDGDPRPVDAVTSGWLRGRRDLDDETRGALIGALYGLLRHHARLGWWLDRMHMEDGPRERALAWLVLVEGLWPEAVTRRFPALTEDEAGMLADLKGQPLDHPDMPETTRLECPGWAEASLRARFGAAFAAEMAACLAPPPLDLRINPNRTTQKAVLRELADMGLRAEKTPHAPHGIRVPERFSLARLASLKSGAVEIQDEGSQLVAALVDARPGERVADFCAGAGGKTLAMAAQMQGRGRIVACDVSEGRLKRCAERLKAAGLHNTETRLLTSETDKWVKRRKGTFDRVLIDAPCSGTGTWRRNPDTRWRGSGAAGLADLVALQSRIFASAARLVKPGGRLVYATCSLLPEENEVQVAAFLAAHPAFRLVPLGDVMPDIASISPGDFLSLTPACHDTDGFFAAVLERASVPAPPA